MKFTSKNPDHYFTTSCLNPPELTHMDKILAKGILTSYPRFKCIEMDDITVDLLGEVTQRSNPYQLKPLDREFIENKVLGMFYKFYRRCLSSQFKEKMCLDSFFEYMFIERDVKLVEKLEIRPFYDGIQPLVEDKLHLLMR
jgi:hypothetical protein